MRDLSNPSRYVTLKCIVVRLLINKLIILNLLTFCPVGAFRWRAGSVIAWLWDYYYGSYITGNYCITRPTVPQSYFTPASVHSNYLQKLFTTEQIDLYMIGQDFRFTAMCYIECPMDHDYSPLHNDFIAFWYIQYCHYSLNYHSYGTSVLGIVNTIMSKT